MTIPRSPSRLAASGATLLNSIPQLPVKPPPLPTISACLSRETCTLNTADKRNDDDNDEGNDYEHCTVGPNPLHPHPCSVTHRSTLGYDATSLLVNPVSRLPQLSETQILSYARYLSEDIGYRTVGTKEHALADKWLTDKVFEMKQECESIVNKAREDLGVKRRLECEVWRQEGSGSHRFDMMGKRLYKTYVNLTNIIVRVSNGTPEGKEHAVLVNSHLDSTLPSPGAADDALSVGVMLECIRVLMQTPNWEPKHSVIFLFNNAEESLQDASHLFSTQHPIASTVRAFVNLEAAGTVGPELLFQANSEQMIQAYSKVPRPFGTIVANEVFSSGVLLSDTDFRQFELYLNVTGLDMAVVGNSYMYHTRKDIVEHLQPGVAQHMAENVLAILQYLSSDESPLPSLDFGYTPPSTVFFSHLGAFFLYSYSTARVLYGLLFASSLVLVHLTYRNPAPALKNGNTGIVSQNLRAMGATLLASVGALVSTNVLAVIMQYVLGKGMSWFAIEFSALALYGPAALAGAFATQLLVAQLPERTMFTALLLTQSAFAFAIQMIGIGSSAMLYMTALPLFFALLLDHVFTGGSGPVSLWTYALGQLTPLLTGTQLICTVFDVFVPLSGRTGREAPAEHIIASLVAITGSYTLPLVLPFSHRYGPRMLLRAVLFLAALTVAVIAIFAGREPFDALHQKRLFVLSSENVVTHERYLHIGTADGAPGFDTLVNEIAAEFGGVGVAAVQEEMNDWNGDWDILYPFSAFMSPYRIPLSAEPGYVSSFAPGGKEEFLVEAVNDFIDEQARTRSLTLKISHPGVIWTVIAFDAHVLQWTLDDAPPDEYTRHHIREASFYGVDTWNVDLVIKIPDALSTAAEDGDARSRAALKINFVGVQERAMWPGKAHAKEEGGPLMVLFEKLDKWVDKRAQGRVDAMLVGSVGGVVVV
ncbi:hypothetical protein EW146_g8997 [Bondarzewia mesenterica]|uniref:Peptide hydrolase n=1 Tax=Bondarzewia mesenterica TaxID=1095465 RepID=A0A4S4LA87_9AGAM|nr:hypothetical protein EW146_g8997 [Bondarzewia mesenterica]